MAYHLHALGGSFALHYFARSRDRVAFLAELQNSGFAGNVVLHLDDEAAAGARPLRSLLETLQRDAHIYTCGPTGFPNHVLETASALDWPGGQVHHETFSPPQPIAGDSFEVRISGTGQALYWHSCGESDAHGARRVNFIERTTPELGPWIGRIDQAVKDSGKLPLLAARSLGAHTVADAIRSCLATNRQLNFFE